MNERTRAAARKVIEVGRQELLDLDDLDDALDDLEKALDDEQEEQG